MMVALDTLFVIGRHVTRGAAVGEDVALIPWDYEVYFKITSVHVVCGLC